MDQHKKFLKRDTANTNLFPYNTLWLSDFLKGVGYFFYKLYSTSDEKQLFKFFVSFKKYGKYLSKWRQLSFLILVLYGEQ